ncbi:hypothetical protein [Streptomyces sp. MAR4 CNX-425]
MLFAPLIHAEPGPETSLPARAAASEPAARIPLARRGGGVETGPVVRP